jgi:hypothetical protein
MLLMPRIQRRQIERLKSSRSIRVYEAERTHPIERQPKPQFSERRLVRERRQQELPVAQDRRRQDRRNAHQALRPEIRAMLENAGGRNAATIRRGGVYIDEDV